MTIMLLLKSQTKLQNINVLLLNKSWGFYATKIAGKMSVKQVS